MSMGRPLITNSSTENPNGPRSGELYVPEKSAVETTITALIFVVTLAYLLLFRRFTGMDPDEGIVLQGAERILRGEVLYRDFFSFFTPGSYYLYAVLFKILGSSMMVSRTLLAIFGGLFSAFTYLMARRVCSRGFALFAAYLVTITCLPWRFLTLHNWDSTVLACASAYCAIRFLESSGPRWLFCAGSFASLTFLFEQSKGGGLILGMGLGFVILAAVGPSQNRLGRKQWMIFGAGLSWPFVLTISYFAWQHSFTSMISDWLWPLRHYSAANRVPFGFQIWPDILGHVHLSPGAVFGESVGVLAVVPSLILPALPLVAILLGAYWVIGTRRQNLGSARIAYYIFITSVLAGLALSVVIGRADVLHFVYLIPLSYLVLVWILEGKDIRGGRSSPFWTVVTLGVFLSFTTTGLSFLIISRSAHVSLETRRGTVHVGREDSAVEFLQANVPPGSKIVVYPYLPLYYFLTATFSPTRFEYLQPGMHTPEQEEEMIREMSNDRTPVVLFELGFSQKIASSWPSTPIKYAVEAPVADFIFQKYRPCKSLTSAAGWHFLYMVRMDLFCPGGRDTRQEIP